MYANLYGAFHEWYFVLIYVAAVADSASTCGMRSGARPRPGRGQAEPQPDPAPLSAATAIVVTVAFAAVPIAFWTDILPARPPRGELMATLDARIPEGPIEDKWHAWLDDHRLVGPRQRGDHTVIVVGTGLAGASASATLAGMGYKVEAFCFQDSARRAHSIAAQGGINATKDYANEGDSVKRLFVDTMKGGDFRAREANVWRLAETSTNIIDQAVAQGVPFNREYGGHAGDAVLRRRSRRAHLLLPWADRPAAAARRLFRPAAAGRRGPSPRAQPPRAPRRRPRRR